MYSILLADAPADGPLVLATGEHAGRRGMDVELVLEAQGADVVPRSRPSLVFGEKLRHENVVAIGNKDFLAGDAVMLAPARVMRRHRTRAQGAEIGSGLRLGQVHRPGPFP